MLMAKAQMGYEKASELFLARLKEPKFMEREIKRYFGIEYLDNEVTEVGLKSITEMRLGDEARPWDRNINSALKKILGELHRRTGR